MCSNNDCAKSQQLRFEGYLGAMLPRSELTPGILAMMEGWLKECAKVVTVIAGFVEAILLTWLRSHVLA